METSPRPILTLKLLGTLEVGPPGDARAATLLRHRRRLGLLLYLVARPSGERVQRDTLTWLFWPDSDDIRARNALSQALHVLRRTAGPDIVLAEGDQVWANSDQVASDVQAFRGDLAAGRPIEALDRYRGDLLEGFHLAGLPEFEEWMATEREALRGLALKAAWSASSRTEAAGDREGALRYARRALDLSPLDEEGARRLMALHLRCGNRAGAVQVYEALARRMEVQLGVEPSLETRAALEAVRGGEVPKPLRASSSVPRAEPGIQPADTARRTPQPAHRGRASRATIRRTAPWASAGALALAGFLLVRSMPWPGTPPVVEGSLAVVNVSSHSPRSEAVEGRVVEILSGADFPSALLTLPETEGEDRPDRLRGDGLEAILRLEDAPHGLQAALVRVRNNGLLGVVPLPDSLSEAAAADRAAGLAALHLDRRLASWGEVSSVVPGYGAFQAFQEAIAAWRDGRSQDRTPALQRALALEPWFPLAILELAGRELARTPPVDSLMREVAAERPLLSEVERLFLDYLEAGRVQNRIRQYEAARSLAERVPERFLAPAVAAALALGRYEEALALGAGLPTEPSAFRNPVALRIVALHALGRHQEELELARQMTGEWVNLEVLALAALGREEEIQGLLRERAAQSAFPGLAAADMNLRAQAISELRVHGHEREARLLVEEGLRFLQRPAGEDLGVMVRVRFHRAAGRLEDWERAVGEALERALREVPDGSGRLALVADLGLIAAARGDVETALHYEAQVAALVEDTTLVFHPRDYPEIMASRGRIHAVLGNEEEAVDFLARALALGLSHLALRDMPEFARLRGNPGFDRLVQAPVF